MIVSTKLPTGKVYIARLDPNRVVELRQAGNAFIDRCVSPAAQSMIERQVGHELDQKEMTESEDYIYYDTYRGEFSVIKRMDDA